MISHFKSFWAFPEHTLDASPLHYLGHMTNHGMICHCRRQLWVSVNYVILDTRQSVGWHVTVDSYDAVLQLRPTLLDKSSSETNCWILFSVIFRAKLTKSSTALYKVAVQIKPIATQTQYQIHLRHYPTLQHTPHYQQEVPSLHTSLPFHDIPFSWPE